MSEWYEADSEEIDLDLKSKEVNIYVTANDFGSVYVTLTFNQIKSIYNRIVTVELPLKNQGQEDK